MTIPLHCFMFKRNCRKCHRVTTTQLVRCFTAALCSIDDSDDLLFVFILLLRLLCLRQKKKILEVNWEDRAALYQKYLCSSIYWPGAARGSFPPPTLDLLFLSHFGRFIYVKPKKSLGGRGVVESEEARSDCCMRPGAAERGGGQGECCE